MSACPIISDAAFGHLVRFAIASSLLIFSIVVAIKLQSDASAKLLQSCTTLCDPTDGSPPGSPVPGILQARTLEWVAISFSNAWKWKVKVKTLSHIRLLATPWTAAYQAPPSMGFSISSIPGWGTKTLQAARVAKKNRKMLLGEFWWQ